MGEITIDCQVVNSTCDGCGAEFLISRGGVYEDGKPVGLYLAAMHGCEAKMALLAIGLRVNPRRPEAVRSITLDVWPTATEIQMSVTDPEDSPWREEEYLRPIMSRAEALASPLLPDFFQVAEEIALREPVSGYLND
jgi:hypothetical protein